METNIKIRVHDFNVEEFYFTFRYQVWIDGILEEESVFGDDHDRHDDKYRFLQELKSGVAVRLVLELLHYPLKKKS